MTPFFPCRTCRFPPDCADRGCIWAAERTESDRDAKRALVDAGYLSLAEYIREYGEGPHG